jgi:hypothetical protein
MNKEQIVEKIKETEEQLASLRKQLEQPEFPTLAEAKPGDMLENFCVVVHKFSDVRMALIAAPEPTERYFQWSKEFSDVFDALEQAGFNRSQWFIPTVEQLQLAYKNCREHFAACGYWSSAEDSSANSWIVYFTIGIHTTPIKTNTFWVRAFSLVSY